MDPSCSATKAKLRQYGWAVKTPAILRGATAEHVLERVKLLVALAQV